ncbi:MAG TPA: NAD(P)H-binding protein [Mycobacterium sp.]|nr:NAD(P)H-binding protein [Mycobacterium sp.]HUH71923.1 NAD(P)H-binding protein [Mycobacterium sp.]
MRILVAGATGYVGSRLVTALLANQHQVVAATRNPARLKRLGWFDDVAPVTLDVFDPNSAQAAFASSRDAVGPLAGALRTGLDILSTLTPKVRTA